MWGWAPVILLTGWLLVGVVPPVGAETGSCWYHILIIQGISSQMCHKTSYFLNNPKDEIFTTPLTAPRRSSRLLHRYAVYLTTGILQRPISRGCTLNSINRLFRAKLSHLIVPIKCLHCKKHQFFIAAVHSEKYSRQTSWEEKIFKHFHDRSTPAKMTTHFTIKQETQTKRECFFFVTSASYYHWLIIRFKDGPRKEVNPTSTAFCLHYFPYKCN